MDNVIKNKHSGLTQLETAIRNLQSEVRYYTYTGDANMARTINAEVIALQEKQS